VLINLVPKVSPLALQGTRRGETLGTKITCNQTFFREDKEE